MSINVKASIQDLINQAYAEKPDVETIDFVGRLIMSELNQAKDQAKKAFEPNLTNPDHKRAFDRIKEYVLERHSLTEAVGILKDFTVHTDGDLNENNLRVLASSVVAYENTWQFWKKVDLISEVNEILEPKVLFEIHVETNAS